MAILELILIVLESMIKNLHDISAKLFKDADEFRGRKHVLGVYFWFFIHYVLLRCSRVIIRFRKPNRQIIAINLTEHLGDIVACEPVSRYVRQQYPEAYITWCIQKPYKELIESNPYVDSVLVVQCLTEWIYLKKSRIFDKYVDLHINGRICPVCNVPLSNKAGSMNIGLDNYFEYGNILSAFSQSAGLPSIDEEPKVYIPPQIYSDIDKYRLPLSFIAIHCLSNEEVKNWSNRKWNELVLDLIEKWNVNVVEVGHSPVIKEVNPQYYYNLCGKLSILETAEVVRRSNLFIGVDSGPAHLANAVGTYGVVLIGDYRKFTKYMPFSGKYKDGSNAHIIYGEGPASCIEVSEVLTVLHKLFSEKRIMV